MSIIIFATLEDKGQPVHGIQIPVGWNMPEPAKFRQSVIWEVIIHDALAKERLPAFDKVSVASDGVEISGDVFSPVFQFRQLLRAGADRETMKMVSDHRVALAALDRSGYTDEQNVEWNDAGFANTILFNELSRKNADAR